MNIGLLNKRVRIERKTSAVDPSYGTPIDAWDFVAVAWCGMQDELPSRSEAVRNGVEISTQRARLRMRYRNDITSDMRVVVDGYTYHIVSGPAVIGRNDGLEMFVQRYSING